MKRRPASLEAFERVHPFIRDAMWILIKPDWSQEKAAAARAAITEAVTKEIGAHTVSIDASTVIYLAQKPNEEGVYLFLAFTC